MNENHKPLTFQDPMKSLMFRDGAYCRDHPIGFSYCTKKQKNIASNKDSCTFSPWIKND